MTLLLWLGAYLLVGFLVVVGVERYWPNRPIAGPPTLFSHLLWPFVLGVLVLAYAIDRLEWAGEGYEDFIRYCARRLPPKEKV